MGQEHYVRNDEGRHFEEWNDKKSKKNPLSLCDIPFKKGNIYVMDFSLRSKWHGSGFLTFVPHSGINSKWRKCVILSDSAVLGFSREKSINVNLDSSVVSLLQNDEKVSFSTTINQGGKTQSRVRNKIRFEMTNFQKNFQKNALFFKKSENIGIIVIKKYQKIWQIKNIIYNMWYDVLYHYFISLIFYNEKQQKITKCCGSAKITW